MPGRSGKWLPSARFGLAVELAAPLLVGETEPPVDARRRTLRLRDDDEHPDTGQPLERPVARGREQRRRQSPPPELRMGADMLVASDAGPVGEDSELGPGHAVDE